MNGISKRSQIIVELDRVSSGYGGNIAVILDNFSLQFERGLIYVLLGPNGCGKSTMLMTICGIIPVLTGKIIFNTPSKHATGAIEYIPQNYREALFPWKTVENNVNCWSKDDETAVKQNSTRTAIELTGLQALKNRFPDDLSGGQQQLVLLARCLVAYEPILIMDEPFSALDIARRFQLVSSLRDFWHASGKTIICSIHEAEIAARLADRVVILQGPPLRIECVINTSEYATTEKVVDDIIKYIAGSAPVSKKPNDA